MTYVMLTTFTPTVIKNLSSVFAIFGMPAYIHSDRGSSFMSNNLKTGFTQRTLSLVEPHHTIFVEMASASGIMQLSGKQLRSLVNHVTLMVHTGS